jgi:hypothetical protein
MQSLVEIFWYLRQYSRELREFRRGIRLAWDDTAARTISSRYLDPHEKEGNRLIGSIDEQMRALDLADEKLRLAGEHIRMTGQLSLLVLELLEFIRQDTRAGRNHHDMYVEHLESAKAILPKVQKLVDQANHACDGVPDE